VAHVTPAEWAALAIGQLSPQESADVTRHLAGCVDCRLRVGWTGEAGEVAANNSSERDGLSGLDGPDGVVTHAVPPRLGDTRLLDEATAARDQLPRGTGVGRYLILERLGVGGMGMVYAAYDPQLDRKVAIKLLRANLGRNQEQFHARMLREAQAMARLSHPNVIAVHDVGTFDERVFLAMELVEGGTLKRWLRAPDRARRPSLRRILEVFIHAGRGLAAAHAAGLVHRDFKPENVLIDGDGRARVTDFGLARSFSSREEPPPSTMPSTLPPGAALDEPVTRELPSLAPQGAEAAARDEDSGRRERSQEETAELGQRASEADDTRAQTTPILSSEISRDPDLPSLDESLTRAGTVMGTPGYMAPEQCRGEPTDARGDQFSFCASLYEAVYGHRAFVGNNAEEIMDRVVAGQIREAPADSRVPGWVRRVLLRGLSVDPAARYPSMDALLDELDRDPAQRRRRWLVAAGALVTAGALVVVAQRFSAHEVQMCRGAERKLAGVWDAPRRDALRTAFARSHKVYAARAADTAVAALDNYAAGWVAMNSDACEATRLRGTETEGMMALRLSCLEERRKDFGALADVLIVADDETIEKAVQAVSALPSLSTCADVQALSAVAPLPTDPTLRAHIAEERTRLATARALLMAGKFSEGLGIAAAIPARATALGYRPLEAEALELVGELRFKAGDYAGSDRAWKDAIYAAEESRLDEVKSQAAVRLADVSVDLHGFTEAHDWLRYAEASIKRFGGRGELQVNLWIRIALVYFRESRFAEAEAAARRAVKLAAEVLAPGGLGRAAAYRTLGDVLKYEARYDEGLQLIEEARQIYAAALGPEHPDTAAILRKEIDVYAMRGDGPRALELGRRVLAVLSKSLPADHLQIAQTHTNISEALGLIGRYEEAIAEERLALPTYERVFGPESENVGVSCTNIGFALLQLGRLAEARQTLLRAVAAYEKRLPHDAPDLAEPMVHLGNVELRDGHARAALGWFERALTLRQNDRDATELLAAAELGTAQALWASGSDRTRALMLATRARDQLVSSNKKDELAAVTAFLAQARR
jgi:serine/threonine protein kinase/tetratricopeptide (TPR) repeat protein